MGGYRDEEFSTDLYIDEGGYGYPLIVRVVFEERRAWCEIVHDPDGEFRPGCQYGTAGKLRKLSGMEAIAWLTTNYSDEKGF